MSALNEGSKHYKHYKIQPVEFIHANDLTFLQGCIIKRICRYPFKDKLQDLLKAKHEIDLLIELEGWDAENRILHEMQTSSVSKEDCKRGRKTF